MTVTIVWVLRAERRHQSSVVSEHYARATSSWRPAASTTGRPAVSHRSSSPTYISAPPAARRSVCSISCSHVESEYLYLIGDIVDGWRLQQEWFWPERHREILPALLARAGAAPRWSTCRATTMRRCASWIGAHASAASAWSTTRSTGPPTAAACWWSTATRSMASAPTCRGSPGSARSPTKPRCGSTPASTGRAAGSASATGRCRRS